MRSMQRQIMVVDNTDNDGGAVVDLQHQVGQGQVMVEGGVPWVLDENAGNVVRVGGGGDEDEQPAVKSTKDYASANTLFL